MEVIGGIKDRHVVEYTHYLSKAGVRLAGPYEVPDVVHEDGLIVCRSSDDAGRRDGCGRSPAFSPRSARLSGKKIFQGDPKSLQRTTDDQRRGDCRAATTCSGISVTMSEPR